jgi:16S rRNA (adenine1518-N6/adenine1519-N6)-dimethyltransferase
MTHPKQILSRYGIDPKKSLGQNFLVDNSILTGIVEAASLTDSDEVLEVGPGLGDLTRLLASASKRVVGVEIDGRFIPILETRLVGWQNVQIIQGNILDVVPGEIFQGNYKVVGNLPYYITGQLFRKFLSFEIKPSLLLFTVQKEVAQRITAGPGKMSLLALIVQFYSKVKLVRTIKAGTFCPRPNVDSAIIRLDVFESSPLSTKDEARFIKLAKVGFSHKRKQLQKNLRQLGFSNAELSSFLSRAGIDGTRRAESLSLEEWLLLYQTLY